MMNKQFCRQICLITLMFGISHAIVAQSWNPNHVIGTVTGKYHFAYNQMPDQLVEIYAAAFPNTGLTYQWEQSAEAVANFSNIPGATLSSYSFPAPLGVTTYYRRKTISGGNYIHSNTIKITVVSTTWEDINYVREHTVNTIGITSWTSVDQLPIGQKLQSTTYMDGLGRPVQSVSRETATPPSNPNSLWGDIVEFALYDAYGRQQVQYLPYTTTSQSGKFKTAPLTEQPQYYTTNYSESSAYSTITFDNSPLNRSMNIKRAGVVWAAGLGTSAVYGMNSIYDYVRIFSVDYTQGNAPLSTGYYPANSLFRNESIDENGKKVVEYVNKSGQLILKKVQLDNTPTDQYVGWICTYFVYDDLGLLRFQLQPEAVKYLDVNSWSFAGTNGQQVLAEQCFQYNYDEKGRMSWKKAPGAVPLNTIYDNRDRAVFLQDGNQALMATPQWTATIYDELDRPVISTLYNTTKTITALKTDIANSAQLVSVTINNAGTVSVTAVTSYNPVSSASLNNSSVCTVLKYAFYDNYSFNGVKTFNTNYTNLSAYSTSDPNVIPIAWSKRTINMNTGSMTRVLGSTTFLNATHYFDEVGNGIQVLQDNIKSGVEVGTVQYHFDGRIISTCSDHTVPATNYTNFKTLTKYTFDKLGRMLSTQKQFGSNAMKTMASYEYDDVGRIKSKRLDPAYTAGGNTSLESLNYTFNIHNQITGINKDYALKNPANYNKWGHFFGLYVGFDNRDNVFSSANLNGQVTGLLWNTQGDNAQRRYDYTYDNAGRLTNSAYTEKQHTGDAWSNSQMDFSVSGTSSKITYDLNGNLQNMLHKGVVPGTASPITIDNLNYTYANYSNKLQSVTDLMTSTAVNGKFGDFKDGVNGANPDYVYDANGNMVIDLNKNVQSLSNGAPGTNGIKYNFLDKPEEIRIVGKGTIKIVYNSNGEKLQRQFIPEPNGATITTSYISSFVYQESSAGGGLSLQYISFEEGRIRSLEAFSQGNGLDALTIDGNMDLPGGKRGVYDYYISDYQQNVRMILTEEIHIASNTGTMETARATLEESIFGQTGVANEVSTTRYPTPSTWTNGSLGSYVSRLGTNSGHNVGPNTLQKVMAGDKINASVQYYYQSTAGGNNTNFPATVLGSLVQAIGNGPATSANHIVGENASAITTQLNSVPGFVNALQPGGSNPGGNTPQAYLTILFFDERFNFISAADGGVAQTQVEGSVGGNGSVLALPDVKAPKNGYAYIYVSNQSNNDVYFDNFLVGKTGGNIIEENHYYAYGLKISAISSKKFDSGVEGALANKYLYNGKEFFEDADLGWYDYGFRNYDPQIGRFPQLDPLTNIFPFLTPYQYAGGDPITNIDIDGLEGTSSVGGASNAARQFSYIYTGASSIFMPPIRSLNVAVSAVNQLSHVFSYASLALSIVANTANIINTSITTGQVGDRASIYMRGLNNAYFNAMGAGIHDAIWGTNLSDYTDPYDKQAYLQGRLAGDALALAHSAAEIQQGASNGLRGALTSGGGSVIAGGVVVTHGTAVTLAATIDIQWAAKKLLEIERLIRAPSTLSCGPGGATGPDGTSYISNDAKKIGGGHAWDKHKIKENQFPEISNQTEFQKLVDNIMKSSKSLHKKLKRGREAWYDESTNTLVIKDPNSADGGTMFRPRDKIEYFNTKLN